MIFSVIPDSRYCFDIERPQTSLGELVENYINNNDKPRFKDDFDQRFYHKNVRTHALWQDYESHKTRQVEPSTPGSHLTWLSNN